MQDGESWESGRERVQGREADLPGLGGIGVRTTDRGDRAFARQAEPHENTGPARGQARVNSGLGAIWEKSRLGRMGSAGAE